MEQGLMKEKCNKLFIHLKIFQKMNLINFNRLPHRSAWNNLIDEVFQTANENSFNRPATNIKETETAYAVEIAAPGLKKEDFEIKIEKDQLLVTAKRSEEKKETKDKYSRKEFSFVNFKRSFHLNETLDADKIEASYEAGVLTINIPKKEEVIVKPKMIAVS